MRRKNHALALLLWLCLPVFLAGGPRGGTDSVEHSDVASGLGVSLPLVARLIGAGPTLYTSTVDVDNYTSMATEVDFYLDGTDLVTSSPISRSGSISSSGALVPQGTGGPMRARSNAHFDDFIDSLVQAGILPTSLESNGFIGSVLFVFNGFSKSGQGGSKVRFYSSLIGGTVGQSLRGYEVTSNEPQSLVASFRDSRGKPGPQLYANMFLNNLGLTPSGGSPGGPVTVHIQAYAASTGQPVGAGLDTSIGPGQTVGVVDVFQRLQVPAGEDTVLVFVTVTSGTAAIAGAQVQVDVTTRDGSVMDMNRADF